MGCLVLRRNVTQGQEEEDTTLKTIGEEITRALPLYSQGSIEVYYTKLRRGFQLPKPSY